MVPQGKLYTRKTEDLGDLFLAWATSEKLGDEYQGKLMDKARIVR
jgi:hypothetical protein